MLKTLVESMYVISSSLHMVEKSSDILYDFVCFSVQIEIYRSPVPKLIGLLTLLVVFAIALRYASEKLWKIAMVICSFKPLWVAASLVRNLDMLLPIS